MKRMFSMICCITMTSMEKVFCRIVESWKGFFQILVLAQKNTPPRTHEPCGGKRFWCDIVTTIEKSPRS